MKSTLKFKFKACDCSGLSEECVFNETLYQETGHGGYCINCRQNTEGAKCENCKYSFYRPADENECLSCSCNELGSKDLQCDPFGVCRCKPGVTGQKCDRCAPNYYELTNTGCKMCSCNQIGSFDNPPVCNPINGKCNCKENVEGQNCDRYF